MFGENKIIWKLVLLVLIIILGLLFISNKNKKKDITNRSVNSNSEIILVDEI